MPNYAYERLRAQDASFLLFEEPNTHMHVSWAWIFDGGPLVRPDGGIDIERIRRFVASRLYRFPRFRQRLTHVPMEGHPLWIDDENFKLHYHVRHASLPEPGDEARLRTATAAIISQPLDRAKPLWELWVVEGLDDDRFAIISKTHHCMVDGVSTVDLMNGLLDETPTDGIDDPVDWIPRPAPPADVLLRDAVIDRMGMAARLAQRTVRACISDPDAGALNSVARDLVHDVRTALTRAPASPINQPIGPHRLVHWLRLDHEMLRTVGRRLGGTVNDVLLAAIAGGLRRFLGRRPGDVDEEPLRVALPAHLEPSTERGVLGNRASAWIVPLPTHVESPLDRFRDVLDATHGFKDRRHPRLGESVLAVAEVLGGTSLSAAVRLRHWMHSYNLIVTSIPGPRSPRYLLGAPLRAAYPHVPLFRDQALSIAVASYLGGLHVGLTADWEVFPTLAELARDVEHAVEELRTASARPTLSVVSS